MFLGVLHLEKVTYAPQGAAKIVSLWGTPAQIERAAAVLKVVDSAEDYCVENLGPASIVRTLPANTVLAMGLGGIDIGTFSEPPTSTGGCGRHHRRTGRCHPGVYPGPLSRHPAPIAGPW